MLKQREGMISTPGILKARTRIATRTRDLFKYAEHIK